MDVEPIREMCLSAAGKMRERCGRRAGEEREINRQEFGKYIRFLWQKREKKENYVHILLYMDFFY